MRATEAKCHFQPEPLARPFGFKGGYLTEIWQSVVLLRGEGVEGMGLGSQSVLWADANVFAQQPESAANGMMFQLTDFAATLATEMDWETPLDLLDRILEPVWAHGRKLTGRPDLRTTFALNALVPVDNAAWLLYARAHNLSDFHSLVPPDVRDALAERQARLALVPLMSYGLPIDGVVRTVDEGCSILKIKIGSDPDHDGHLDKMLEWDKARITAIHRAVGHRTTPYTADGRIAYYLDANGRYDTLDRLRRLLDHIDHLGALDRVILLEEPFAEEAKIDVSPLPVRVAADESAHTDGDVLARIALGYRAIALKPIAKTLSMTFRILQAARKHGVPCFCADLTVNPILVDWNKNVAAGLPAPPGMRIGVLETNGAQNYRRWPEMQRYHPCFGADWTNAREGVFVLNEDFYKRSGGILETSRHYRGLVV